MSYGCGWSKAVIYYGGGDSLVQGINNLVCLPLWVDVTCQKLSNGTWETSAFCGHFLCISANVCGDVFQSGG